MDFIDEMFQGSAVDVDMQRVRREVRALGSWAKCILSFLLWGGAALAVYIGIGFVVAECVAWLMGAIR